MAEKDTVENNLIALNAIFSDAVNGLLFHGKEIVKPDDLENVYPKSQYKADDSMVHYEERDVAKYWKKHGVIISILGIESQTKADKDMPLRVIGYDGASYRSELIDRSNHERYPVITIVLYYGTTHWNYSLHLKDSLNIPDFLKDEISDYEVKHLYEISFLEPETVNMFKSDFKIIADYFVQMRINKEYKPSTQVIKFVDYVLEYMHVLTGKDWNNVFVDELKAKGEPITMESAYKEIIEKSEAKGRNEGIAEGRMETASRMLADGMPEDKVIKYSGLSKEEVEKLK